jgi:enoyl-CoA hydratase
VRCTLVTGRGSAFCAGMDTSQFGGDAAHRRALVESTEDFMDALLAHPKPLVAAVNGPALGGGFVLALLCDLRLAAEPACFGFPEVARGIPASYGAARAALPSAVAADLSLTGRVVDAREALRLGIVSEITSDFGARAQAIAALPASATATVTAWARAGRAGAEALLALEREAFRSAVLRG